MHAQTVGHLQMAAPPILPPICQLFGVAHDAPPEARPLHDHREPDASLLQVIQVFPTHICGVARDAPPEARPLHDSCEPDASLLR